MLRIPAQDDQKISESALGIDVERQRVRVATTLRSAVEVNTAWAVNPDFDRSGIHNLGRRNDGRQLP